MGRFGFLRSVANWQSDGFRPLLGRENVSELSQLPFVQSEDREYYTRINTLVARRAKSDPDYWRKRPFYVTWEITSACNLR